MAQLETALASTKRDYELLRIEFEKTVASNEQAAPIAKELQVRCTCMCVLQCMPAHSKDLPSHIRLGCMLSSGSDQVVW